MTADLIHLLTQFRSDMDFRDFGGICGGGDNSGQDPEADEDDALHLWSLLRHLHAGRRRQDGKHNSVLQPYN